MWSQVGLKKHRYEQSRGDGLPVGLFQILKDDAVKELHSICQEIWKTQKWPQDWKRSVFIPIPKKGNAKVAGTSVGNPVHGKGHEERGLTKCKGGIRPQGSPWTFSSIYPYNQSLPALLRYAFHLLFRHYRGAIPDHLSLEKVNLELQLIVSGI